MRRAGWSNGCVTPRPTRPWASPELRREGAVDELLARLWWDAHVGGPDALAVLVAAQGTDRLVGGTNFACGDQTADPSFGDRALGDVLDDNARRLLRLGR